MFSGIGFGAERLGLAALRFPRFATICLGALVALMASSLPRLTFDDDIHRVFLSDSALSVAQRTYEAALSPDVSTLLIHVTSPRVPSPREMTALRDLALDLEFVEGVESVASVFALRWPPTPDAPSGMPVFGTRIGANYMDGLAAFKALESGLPTFVNDTGKALLFSVVLNTDETQVDAALTAIDAELDRALPPGLTAHLTGEDVISAEIVDGLKADLVALNLWGALVITLAAFALLRDLAMALLAVVPALLGTAGVLALSVWLGYPITVLSNVIPILLLVLGVADGLHLTGHLKTGKTLRDAIVTIGPACALTAFTTTLAFAAIMLTGNAQLFEFAVLGALGTVLSFCIVIVTFALLGQVVHPSDRPIPRFSAIAARRLVRMGIAKPRSIITGGLLLLGMSGIGFVQTKAWFPLYQNLPLGSPTLTVKDAIAEDFGGVFQAIVETGSDWTALRDLVQQLEAVSGPRTVLSEVNLARWLGDPGTRPASGALDVLPQPLIDRLRGEDGLSRIFVSVPEPMRNSDTLAAFDRLRDTALGAGADRVIGLPAIMRQEAVSLINQLSLGLVAAALGATMLVAIAYRSIRLLPVLFIPNILPLMLTAASLHLWAQGLLTPTAVLALTLAFGIAIDDTIHFISRYSDARASGETPRQAVACAAASAGQAMVLTTVLLTAGLAVTLFSNFTPIRMFGGMMIVTLWTALLIDLVLLPALLTWKGKQDVTS